LLFSNSNSNSHTLDRNFLFNHLSESERLAVYKRMTRLEVQVRWVGRRVVLGGGLALLHDVSVARARSATWWFGVWGPWRSTLG
jgi:hypothetical protein